MQAMFPAAAVPTAPSRHAPLGAREAAHGLGRRWKAFEVSHRCSARLQVQRIVESEEAEAREVAVTSASACASRAERSSGAGAAPACAAGQTRNPVRGLALLQVRRLFSAGFSATEAADAAPARHNGAV